MDPNYSSNTPGDSYSDKAYNNSPGPAVSESYTPTNSIPSSACGPSYHTGKNSCC